MDHARVLRTTVSFDDYLERILASHKASGTPNLSRVFPPQRRGNLSQTKSADPSANATSLLRHCICRGLRYIRSEQHSPVVLSAACRLYRELSEEQITHRDKGKRPIVSKLNREMLKATPPGRPHVDI